MPLNLTISPAQTEVVIAPDITFTQAYSVTNDSDTSLVLSTSVLPWQPVGSDGSLTYTNISPSRYFEFSLNNADLHLGQSFVLAPRQTRQLVLKIKSSSVSPEGDSYFTFFINQDQSDRIGSDISGSGATARLGSHLLISTSSTENPPSRLTITSFQATPKFVDVFFPRVRLIAQVNNQSKFFTKTNGKLTITKNNRTVSETILFPDNVLAHSSRELSCLSNNEPVPCTLSPPFWPGVYQATIDLDPSLSSQGYTTAFIAFPFSIIIFVLLISTFIYLLRRQK